MCAYAVFLLVDIVVLLVHQQMYIQIEKSEMSMLLKHSSLRPSVELNGGISVRNNDSVSGYFAQYLHVTHAVTSTVHLGEPVPTCTLT